MILIKHLISMIYILLIFVTASFLIIIFIFIYNLKYLYFYVTLHNSLYCGNRTHVICNIWPVTPLTIFICQTIHLIWCGMSVCTYGEIALLIVLSKLVNLSVFGEYKYNSYFVLKSVWRWLSYNKVVTRTHLSISLDTVILIQLILIWIKQGLY